MLSLRLARAVSRPGASSHLSVARLPIIQRRTFLPDSITGRGLLDEKYPVDPELTAAEDPDMVGIG